MKSAVIVFPGSNCDRDAQTALRQVTGQEGGNDGFKLFESLMAAA